VANPKPVPLPTSLVGEKRLEYPAQHLRLHADPGVGNLKANEAAHARLGILLDTVRGDFGHRAADEKFAALGIASRALTARFMMFVRAFPASA